jgi:hypothetical protein
MVIPMENKDKVIWTGHEIVRKFFNEGKDFQFKDVKFIPVEKVIEMIDKSNLNLDYLAWGCDSYHHALDDLKKEIENGNN